MPSLVTLRLVVPTTNAMLSPSMVIHGMSVLSIVDSAGAYPGIGAEELGQAEAIARSTDACL